jgi:hypothetical protein
VEFRFLPEHTVAPPPEVTGEVAGEVTGEVERLVPALGSAALRNYTVFKIVNTNPKYNTVGINA